MYRFYVSADQLAEKEVFISGGDVNHIKNVLRLEVGDWIVACDGNGTDYVSRIQSICSDEVVASIEKVQPTGTELPVRITLFQGMPKKDKLELIIQKAVELGACEIVPVMTKRTVVKLSEGKKINKRLERWQSIAYAAAKQCDRGIIPTVHKPVSYEEALAMADQLDYNVIPYELQTGMEEARKIVDQACKQRSLGIFIGPEGGFEPEEVERAMTRNIHPMTLGKRILRTETAGMALLSILMFQMQGE
ncbi:MAG: 16S rRNA (uracil(1498)-N(3))-methyltransferase [Lachnospiraceae bacterium]|nr:16S rRNA (uracil(1498)-N(3))-methyltransferase [Lachnospiraceae bacterium]